MKCPPSCKKCSHYGICPHSYFEYDKDPNTMSESMPEKPKKNKLKEYSNKEFCKNMKCGYQFMPSEFCKENCIKKQSAYDFHNYLIENGYRIIKKLRRIK